MIVSQLTFLPEGWITARVQAEPADGQPTVEEYLYALDCALKASGRQPVGRVAWRTAKDQPDALECTVAALPKVTLADYRGIVVQSVSASQQVDAHRAAEQAARACELEVPALAIDLEVDWQWRQLERRLKTNHITLQQHLDRLRTTPDRFSSKLRGYAQQDLHLRCALLAIACTEGFTVTDEKLAAAVRQAQLRGIRQPDRMQLRQQLLVQQAVDLIWQNTTVLPAPVQEEQA